MARRTTMDGSEAVIPTESEALSQLRTENATLRLQNENAQLGAEIRRLSRPDTHWPPWWRSRATITTLTTILAAVVPLTTAVHGWAQKDRELALEELKFKTANSLELQKQTNAIAMQRERQTEEIRTSYLERLKAPGEHLRTLRFILATTDDKTLRNWAIEEKNVVEGDLRKLEEEISRAGGRAEETNKSPAGGQRGSTQRLMKKQRSTAAEVPPPGRKLETLKKEKRIPRVEF
jgi:hypothetical protein